MTTSYLLLPANPPDTSDVEVTTCSLTRGKRIGSDRCQSAENVQCSGMNVKGSWQIMLMYVTWHQLELLSSYLNCLWMGGVLHTAQCGLVDRWPASLLWANTHQVCNLPAGQLCSESSALQSATCHHLPLMHQFLLGNAMPPFPVQDYQQRSRQRMWMQSKVPVLSAVSRLQSPLPNNFLPSLQNFFVCSIGVLTSLIVSIRLQSKQTLIWRTWCALLQLPSDVDKPT
jgi:hypothetical protein